MKYMSEKKPELKFVVHEHAASHLHYDLRLERQGVLKSWAVPKAPPETKGVRRLAIEVEDHPLSYGSFEGEIVEGYGKGLVKIWDQGGYEPEKWEEGKIVFRLKGKRLSGRYILLRTSLNSVGKGKTQWLFFKLGNSG